MLLAGYLRQQIIHDVVGRKNTTTKYAFIHPDDESKRQIDQYPKAINKHNEVTSWEWPQSDRRQRSKRRWSDSAGRRRVVGESSVSRQRAITTMEPSIKVAGASFDQSRLDRTQSRTDHFSAVTLSIIDTGNCVGKTKYCTINNYLFLFIKPLRNHLNSLKSFQLPHLEMVKCY